MCVRLNNIKQLKQLRKYLYQSYNEQMQMYYNHLLKIKNRQTLSLFQQFKLELYKLKVLNKTVEFKLEKMSNGLLNLLVFRVIITINFNKKNFPDLIFSQNKNQKSLIYFAKKQNFYYYQTSCVQTL